VGTKGEMLILTFNLSLASDDLCDAALGRRVNSPQGPVKGLCQEIFGEFCSHWDGNVPLIFLSIKRSGLDFHLRYVDLFSYLFFVN
jgi:hypothetical protein